MHIEDWKFNILNHNPFKNLNFLSTAELQLTINDNFNQLTHIVTSKQKYGLMDFSAFSLDFIDASKLGT